MASGITYYPNYQFEAERRNKVTNLKEEDKKGEFTEIAFKKVSNIASVIIDQLGSHFQNAYTNLKEAFLTREPEVQQRQVPTEIDLDNFNDIINVRRLAYKAILNAYEAQLDATDPIRMKNIGLKL
jgi:hypothetical protein